MNGGIGGVAGLFFKSGNQRLHQLGSFVSGLEVDHPHAVGSPCPVGQQAVARQRRNVFDGLLVRSHRFDDISYSLLRDSL